MLGFDFTIFAHKGCRVDYCVRIKEEDLPNGPTDVTITSHKPDGSVDTQHRVMPWNDMSRQMSMRFLAVSAGFKTPEEFEDGLRSA